MSEKIQAVVNTGPLIALVAATGDLSLLRDFFPLVTAPYEVCREISINPSFFGVEQFKNATWLAKGEKPTVLSPLLKNMLDSGEASVIQTAIDNDIKTVIIDEAVGRRIARLHGLELTGSLGILLRAKQEKLIPSLGQAIRNMEEKGIWLSTVLKHHVLKLSGEQ